MTYTIGEIARQGLLKRKNGQPYKTKSRVSKELKGKPFTKSMTAWGEAKMYQQNVIDELNARWIKKG